MDRLLAKTERLLFEQPTPAQIGPARWPQMPSALWEAEAHRLAEGDLDGMPVALSTEILRLAEQPVIRQLARTLNLPPVLLVLGTLARWDAIASRGARRVAWRIFSAASEAKVTGVLARLPA